jgi:uncharacterized protein (DUF2147 family)
MKKLLAIAALLMVTTTADAGQYSFQIEGHKIRVSAPRNCFSLSCVQVSAPTISNSGIKGLKSKRSNDDVAVNSDAPVRKSTAAPVEQAADAPQSSVERDAAPASTEIASVAPAVRDEVAPSAPSAVASAEAAPVTAAPVEAADSPIGVWSTQDNKGHVRVEQCGQNLCGYGVEKGEKILINMKPSHNKWTGQIHDPDSGKTYSSTIALKGANTLRVQGCAFGGLFCGGQTWKRIS